jgi:hypothetical protein
MARTAHSPDNEAIRELRDEVKKLNKSTEISNSVTTNLTMKLVDLTVLLFLVGLAQVLISIVSISASWKEGVLLSTIFLYLMYFLIRSMSKNKVKK